MGVSSFSAEDRPGSFPRQLDEAFDVRGVRKEVKCLHRIDAVGFEQDHEIPGKRSWITGDCQDAGGSGGQERLEDPWVHAGPGRVGDDHVRPFLAGC